MIVPVQYRVNSLFGVLPIYTISFKNDAASGWVKFRFLDNDFVSLVSTVSGYVNSEEISILQFYRNINNNQTLDFPEGTTYVVVDGSSGGVLARRNGLRDGNLVEEGVRSLESVTLGLGHLQFPTMFSEDVYSTANLVLCCETGVSGNIIVAPVDNLGYTSRKGTSVLCSSGFAYNSIQLGINDSWGAIIYTPVEIWYDFTGDYTQLPAGESRINADSTFYLGRAKQ
jgi:hypothetical protein